MAEPRARPRNNKAVFTPSEVADLLYAFGDTHRTQTTPQPLTTTVNVLDEILTDFIIETCHYAALSASYSRRQKIKVDDFKFVLRRDERLLGRVLEQLWREKKMKEDRKVLDFEGAEQGAGGLGMLEGMATQGGVEEGEMRERKGRGKDATLSDNHVFPLLLVCKLA
ncbi:uncharacterized protein LTR77_010407 [Saxophila tyrrhenica]|uniref:Transcription initiation factor TFIID subunit 13 n=1 Tax=Saxophila tyrrhenica TaxID=1690608 RepID=A0AAV9NVT3_9PEZI|nr:hypothetical protein LTR77_010407 [Saxophila tyrrhenica]